MKTLYLDLFSGISGDMFLGALLDLGVDLRALDRELRKLDLAGWHLHAERQLKSGIAGMKFDVHLDAEHVHPPGHDHGAHPHPHEPASPGRHGHARKPAAPAAQPHRTFSDIRQLIADSALAQGIKQKAIAVFHRVALAEGKIHNQPPEAVEFHEVGAVDSIIDIVGACVALDLLGNPKIWASNVVEGTGWIDCAHGRLPLPAPATLEILSARGVRLQQCEEPHELVTPTGAALLAELVERFGPMQGLAPNKVGYGLGTRDHQTRPNVLRVLLCEAEDATHDWEIDRVAILQTNLDDVNAEWLGRVLERALEEGALDVFHTPVQMKKNRPGVLLTIVCAESDTDKFAELLLRETTAFGVRFHTTERRKLQREFSAVTTPYGQVAIKLGKLNGQVLQAAPEYDSCRRLADETGVPLKQIYAAALRAIQG